MSLVTEAMTNAKGGVCILNTGGSIFAPGTRKWHLSTKTSVGACIKKTTALITEMIITDHLLPAGLYIKYILILI